MDNKEILRQLKESEDWPNLLKNSRELHNQNPHDRYTVRMLVLAYEKLGEENNAVRFWEILAKGENKPEEFTKKLVQYHKKEDNQEEWLNWSKRLLSQSLRKKDFSTFEDTWMQLIETELLDIPYIFNVVEKIEAINEKERALTILDLSLLSLEERTPLPPEVIDISKRILQIDEENTDARKRIDTYYRIIYKECCEIENFLQKVDLRRSESIFESLKYLERLILFCPGQYVSHKNWGIGKVRSIDILFNKLFIDFPTQPDHPINIDTAFEILTPLKKDHFVVHKIENKENLQILLESNPAKVIQLMLKYEDPLSQDKALVLLEGLLKKEDWQTFVKHVKKNAVSEGIALERKGNKYLFFSESEKKRKKAPIKEIGSIPNLNDRFAALTAIEKDQLEQDEKTLWLDYAHEIITNEEILPEKRVELLFMTIDMSTDKKEKINTLKEIIEKTTIDDKMTIINSLPQRRYKTEFLNIASEYNFPFTERIFLETTDDLVRKHALGILGNEKNIHELKASVFRNPNKYPLCFLFLLESIMKQKEKKELEGKPIIYFETLLEFLTKKDENQKIRQRAKTIFNKFGFDAYRWVLDTSSQEEIKVLIDIIKKSIEIGSEDKDAFERLAGAKYPSLKEKDDSDIFYATRKSINQKRKELDHLVKIEIPANSEAIGKAASQGDLSENFDYISAKEKQRKLIDRVTLLKKELSCVHPIEEIHFVKGEVRIGTHILLEDTNTHEKREIIILGPWDKVGNQEVVSHTAPFASLLLGKKEGDTFLDEYNNKTYMIVRVKKYTP